MHLTDDEREQLNRMDAALTTELEHGTSLAGVWLEWRDALRELHGSGRHIPSGARGGAPDGER